MIFQCSFEPSTHESQVDLFSSALLDRTSTFFDKKGIDVVVMNFYQETSSAYSTMKVTVMCSSREQCGRILF
jgi:hypothetical protein